METHCNVKPPPTLTVIEKSRELHILLSKVIVDENLLNKIYRFSVGKCVTDHSQDVYEALTVANSLDLYDKELTQERLRYQTKARRSLTMLIASLRVLYTIADMAADKMKIILDKTIEVERLLKKWMESDRNRVRTSLNIVKKDEIDTTIFKNEITARDLFSPAPHVDFDLLLRDSRNTIPPVVGATGRTPYIPPGECIQTKPPPVKYVVKSDQDRVNEIIRERYEFDKVEEPPKDMPIMDRPRSEYAVAAHIVPESTKPVVEVTVRDKPIIVPDNRIHHNLGTPSKEEQDKMPISPNVIIQHGGTIEMMTEELPADTEHNESQDTVPADKVEAATSPADKASSTSSK